MYKMYIIVYNQYDAAMMFHQNKRMSYIFRYMNTNVIFAKYTPQGKNYVFSSEKRPMMVNALKIIIIFRIIRIIFKWRFYSKRQLSSTQQTAFVRFSRLVFAHRNELQFLQWIPVIHKYKTTGRPSDSFTRYGENRTRDRSGQCV